MTDADLLAKELDQALLARREIPPLTKSHGGFDLAASYRIQERGIRLRLGRGEKIVGYKMGFTSAAKRAQMGLHLPIYGVLTDGMRVEGTLRAGEGVHPKIEPEVAFVTRRELRGHISREDAFEALASVAPALEVLDSRLVGFKLSSLPDVVADNCSSWKFVLGPPQPPRETGSLRMRMRIDGRVAQEADSNAISGNPLESLVQLVELLPHPLPAGSIVLAGAASVAEPLRAGMEVMLEVEGLGSVAVRAI
ncbi:MAG TPA: fumarylacetoacetate hydrolase family protein [Myxococcales bacterium]|jgi:2-oxo-3-hexenedioate decarboxylase|nr:fumarylacetoacetate hydrolase family protein [Myxococcales bacterium]